MQRQVLISAKSACAPSTYCKRIDAGDIDCDEAVLAELHSDAVPEIAGVSAKRQRGRQLGWCDLVPMPDKLLSAPSSRFFVNAGIQARSSTCRRDRSANRPPQGSALPAPGSIEHLRATYGDWLRQQQADLARRRIKEHAKPSLSRALHDLPRDFGETFSFSLRRDGAWLLRQLSIKEPRPRDVQRSPHLVERRRCWRSSDHARVLRFRDTQPDSDAAAQLRICVESLVPSPRQRVRTRDLARRRSRNASLSRALHDLPLRRGAWGTSTTFCASLKRRRQQPAGSDAATGRRTCAASSDSCSRGVRSLRISSRSVSPGSLQLVHVAFRAICRR